MVYFIQGEQTKRIKIGKADNIAARLRGLQTGSADRLTVLKVQQDTDNDRAYHSRFQADQVYGEWFSPSDTLMAFIDSLPASEFDGLTYLPQNYCAGVPQREVKRKRLRTSRMVPSIDVEYYIQLARNWINGVGKVRIGA